MIEVFKTIPGFDFAAAKEQRDMHGEEPTFLGAVGGCFERVAGNCVSFFGDTNRYAPLPMTADQPRSAVSLSEV